MQHPLLGIENSKCTNLFCQYPSQYKKESGTKSLKTPYHYALMFVRNLFHTCGMGYHNFNYYLFLRKPVLYHRILSFFQE